VIVISLSFTIGWFDQWSIPAEKRWINLRLAVSLGQWPSLHVESFEGLVGTYFGTRSGLGGRTKRVRRIVADFQRSFGVQLSVSRAINIRQPAQTITEAVGAIRSFWVAAVAQTRDFLPSGT
jgi:hypothetical protein